MEVNVNKTKFMIFHSKGIPLNAVKNFYNDNENGTNDPNLIYEIGRSITITMLAKPRNFWKSTLMKTLL
jgi:hypothetical protein